MSAVNGIDCYEHKQKKHAACCAVAMAILAACRYSHGSNQRLAQGAAHAIDLIVALDLLESLILKDTGSLKERDHAGGFAWNL